MITVPKLLTRKEIIQSWEKNETYLDNLCCPSCKDLLYKCGEIYECDNDLCEVDEIKVGA